MVEVDLEGLRRSFKTESEEGLALMEEALMTLERHPRNEEALATVFRTAHTIKGNAAMFDFSDVERLAHVLEELLDRMRERSVAVTGNLVSLILQSVDALREMIRRAVEGGGEMPPSARSLIGQIAHAAAGEGAGGAQGELAGKAWLEAPEAESLKGVLAPTRSARTVRVELDKLDQLLYSTGEIGVAYGWLARMSEDPRQGRASIQEKLHETDALHLELQDLVTRLRMVPVGPTFHRYRPVVRDLARSHGKVARLEVQGEDVEVDASVIELLRNPLTHMIRNALDHGIESPGARSAAGKDPCGLVALKSWHEAGSIVIEVSDDGAGLDRKRILERAHGAGLASGGGAMSAAEIERLIFEPGFSTAEKVTELSGRGVGMDVVRRNIEALRGSVTLSSLPGQGTTLTIRLPLTLAILDGLMVSVAEETFFVPLETVVESVELPPEVRSRCGRGVLNLRGRTLPWVRLRNLFRLAGPVPQREKVLVVEQARDGTAGLVVDGLQGQGQAVIKPLAKLFRGLPGISGSTILGNGRVALILDVPGLLHAAQRPVSQRPGMWQSSRASVRW